MRRAAPVMALLFFACGGEVTENATEKSGVSEGSVSASATETPALPSATSSATSAAIELPPSVSGGLPSPLSVLTSKEVVELIPTDLRRKLLGCWKLPTGEEWRFSARGKEGLSLTQKLSPSSPRYLDDPKPVVVKFSAPERSLAFTSVGGHHPCLIACTLAEETLRCSAACSRRPDDGFPVRVGNPVAERCSAKP